MATQHAGVNGEARDSVHGEGTVQRPWGRPINRYSHDHKLIEAAETTQR